MLASRSVSASLLSPCRSRQALLSRHISSSSRTLSSAARGKKPPPPDEPYQHNVDPHAMANEMVRRSEGRVPGTVAIQNYLTPEQRLKNYGLAASLFAFVGWVWWYSMNAVGQAEDTLDVLASEARLTNEARAVSEQEAQELANLDIGVVEQDLDEEVIVAVAAPEEVAQAEEERNKAVLSKGSKRPLWKRVVFFWKRE